MNQIFSSGNTFEGEEPDTMANVSAITSARFYGKVLALFGMALLVSASGVYTSFQYFISGILANPALIGVAYVAELALVVTSRLWSTKQPLNYFMFAGLAFLTGVTVSPLIAGSLLEFGGPMLLVKALVATTASFSAAAIMAVVTRRSFVGLGGFLMTALVGMIIVSILGIFIPWSNTFEMIFAGFGIIVFVGYTMYDIQRLSSYPPDRSVDAAIQIYLDIFNLFIWILRLMGGLSRR